MTAGVAKFMERGAMPIDRLKICCWRRYLHIVLGRRIVGPIATDTELDAGRLDEDLNRRLDHARKRRRCGGCDFDWQVVALVSVKDGKSLEERNGLYLLAGLSRAALFLGWHEAIG